MIQLSNEIRDELAQLFRIRPTDLEYLAGGREESDGIVFSCGKGKEKQVLKICASEDEEAVERAKRKLEFASFLGKEGIPVAYPNTSEDGKVYQTVKHGGFHYFASVMPYIEGQIPKTHELTPQLLVNWGKLTGKMHRATEKYTLWKRISDGPFEWGFEEEIDGLYQLCRNEKVKVKWLELQKEMQCWEKNRNTYGFIHNDNHQNNILVRNNELTLIDFDTAECNFFLQDLLIPIQGMIFDEVGGFDRPLTDEQAVKRFYESFLKGYETEYHVEDLWLDRLETLLNYRRVLLYTVMQDWMESDEQVGSSFMRMIENPCSFSVV